MATARKRPLSERQRGTFRPARRRSNPEPYPTVTLRRYRGALVRHPAGGQYEVEWGAATHRFRTLAAVKGFIDQHRQAVKSAYDVPARARKNPSGPTVHRGEKIFHDGPAYLVPGIRWAPGDSAVPRFPTLAAAKRFIDRRLPARTNPARKAAPSHDLFGERDHALSLFGDKTYAKLPVAKRAAAERKAKARPGQLGLDLGGTRGLFD